MIGNDIVDLNFAHDNSRCKEQRFLDKVFNAHEKKLINNAEDLTEMIWLLWSMKESAYKIYVQQYASPFLNPKLVNCELFSNYKGRVTIKDEDYSTSSIVTKDFIYTTATIKTSQSLKNGCFFLEDGSFKSQQNIVHQSLIDDFSEFESLTTNNFEIIKNEFEIPKLFLNNTEQPYSISFTHHGNYGGYAIAKV